MIGRNHELFGQELFTALKENNGLTEAEYSQAIKIIRSAHIESDKPPFFKKNSGLKKYPKFQYMVWALAKLVKIVRPLYNLLFSVSSTSPTKMLLKETRSLKNMKSMASGLKVSNLICLVRLPHGTIASHVKGVKKGTMRQVKPSQKAEILSEINQSKLQDLKSLIQNIKQPEDMSDIAYYAASWTLYHEELLELQQLFKQCVICFYDDLVNAPVEQTQQLLAKIGLQYDSATSEFINSSSQGEAPILKDAGDKYFSVYRDASFNKDAWREQLSNEDIAIIDKYCMPMYSKLKDIISTDSL
jgi:hypothetical protein